MKESALQQWAEKIYHSPAMKQWQQETEPLLKALETLEDLYQNIVLTTVAHALEVSISDNTGGETVDFSL